jgi:hypothetical protein
MLPALRRQARKCGLWLIDTCADVHIAVGNSLPGDGKVHFLD